MRELQRLSITLGNNKNNNKLRRNRDKILAIKIVHF